MNLEMIILSEIRQRKTNVTYICDLKKKKKKIQMSLFTKQKQIHRLQKQIYG